MIEPILSRILIHPIKSLDALEVDSAALLASGALQFDRRWALFDASGGFVNGKRHAAVHHLRSAIDLAHGHLTLRAHGRHDLEETRFPLDGPHAALEAWLRSYFGFDVAFRQNGDQGFPDDTESPGPTIISRATLAEIAGWFGLSIAQVRARLRTNLEIDGVPPFWEDRLFGSPGTTVRFSIGDAVLAGVNPCQRCVVPPRDPLTGVNDDTFVRRFTELRSRTLPAWTARERFNHFYRVAINTRLADAEAGRTIRLGDRITILDAETASSAAPSRQGAPFWAGTLTVEGVFEETPTVKTFRLKPPGGGAFPFTFRAGQFLTVTIPMASGTLQRCYTIASSPAADGFCDITVKRDGEASARLHETLRPGALLSISGPMGGFVFNESGVDKVVFVAGGVGITPLMSKIRFLLGMPWAGRIDLIYVVRSSREIVFRRELEALARAHATLGIHITVTGEDAAWTGAKGRLTAAWMRAVVPDIAERPVRLCGPTAMAAATQTLLHDLGVPEAQIAAEAFGGGGRRPVGTAQKCRIDFRRSDRSAMAAEGQTILDVALAANLPLDSGCRAGVCGRCKAHLIAGQVTIDADFVLSPSDKAAGFILTCQAHALGDVVIDC